MGERAAQAVEGIAKPVVKDWADRRREELKTAEAAAQLERQKKITKL